MPSSFGIDGALQSVVPPPRRKSPTHTSQLQYILNPTEGNSNMTIESLQPPTLSPSPPGPISKSDAANSHPSSPKTSHSTFSAFVPSPSITSLPPSSVGSALQSPYVGVDPMSRTPSRASGLSDNQDGCQVQYGGGPMIPVTIDLKSGSRSQAEKRKANSDASRRFRNRKKNEAELEQRINQLSEQVQLLTKERDFYRSKLSERLAQTPPRPPSPAPSRQSTAIPGDQPSLADSHKHAVGVGGEMSKCINTETLSLGSTFVPTTTELEYIGEIQKLRLRSLTIRGHRKRAQLH